VRLATFVEVEVTAIGVHRLVGSTQVNLKIPGAAITKDNVDAKRFWGNLTPPADPPQVIE
jgi:hypothetical protein